MSVDEGVHRDGNEKVLSMGKDTDGIERVVAMLGSVWVNMGGYT